MADMQLAQILDQIRELIAAGQTDEASARCVHVVRRFAYHVEATRLLGQVSLAQGDLPQTEYCLKRTLAADPNDWRARAILGRLYRAQDRLAEAQDQWQRALELNPGNAEVARELALLGQGDGLEQTPAAYGWAYAQSSQHDRAIAQFREALRQDPDRHDVRTGLVEALWHEGRRLEAVEAGLDVVRALPLCLTANLILGQLFLSNGEDAQAEEWLATARALDPENRAAQQLMGADSPLPFRELTLREFGDEATPEPEAGEVQSPVEGVPGVEGEATKEAAGTTEGGAQLQLEAAAVGGQWAPGQPPGWLEDLPQEPVATAAEGLAPLALPPQLAETGAPPVEPSPDWLEEWQAAPEGAVPLLAAELLPAEEVPDWLEEMKPPQAEEVAAPAAESPAEEPVRSEQAVPEAAAEPTAAEVSGAAEETAPPLEPAPGEEEPAEPVPAEEILPPADEPLPPAEEMVRAEQVVPEAEAAAEVSVAAEDMAPPPEPAPGAEEPAGPVPAEEILPPADEMLPATKELPDWVRRLEATIATEGPPPGVALEATPRTGEERQQRVRMGELEAQLMARPHDHRARIELARVCLLRRDWDAAILHYEELVARRKFVPAVIADVQGMLDQDADRVQVYRLLGDAYTEIEDNDLAMEMYRQARETLRTLRQR